MSKEIGTLVIVVLKAQNLPDKHSFWKQDAYAVVSLNGTKKNTVVDVKGGQHPVWDEEIRFPVLKDASESYRTLEVSCWAKEHKEDDQLGQGKVDISNTLKSGEFDDWVKLESNGTYRGEIYLEMTYYANAPPPINRRVSKLAPKDRLARPTQPYQYGGTSPKAVSKPSSNSSSPSRTPQSSPGRGQLSPGRSSAPTSPKGNHLVPPSSRSPSSSPKGRDAALPPLPEDLSAVSTAKPVHVPSLLRPGNPKSSPTPVVPRTEQSTLGRLPGALKSGPSATGAAPVAPRNSEHPPPLTAYPLSHSPPPQSGPSVLSTSGYPPPPVHPTSFHTQSAAAPSGPVSFPVPASGRSLTYETNTNTNYTYSRPQAPYEQPAAQDNLPDPYLIARYQSPLPLPASFPPRASAVPDPSAIQQEARRMAREEEAKRKAQEEADLALARELDRELNLGDLESERQRGRESRSTAGHMPGEW